MSKSYNNTIELFAPEAEVPKQIFSITTDSTGVAEPKDPDKSQIYSILKLFCSPQEAVEWADRFRTGPHRNWATNSLGHSAPPQRSSSSRSDCRW